MKRYLVLGTARQTGTRMLYRMMRIVYLSMTPKYLKKFKKAYPNSNPSRVALFNFTLELCELEFIKEQRLLTRNGECCEEN